MRTLLLGFDAFDPRLFQRLAAQGRLPNLNRYAELGKYSPLEVANPAQSEVSWTSIATGLNPGRHGIFDFVHRDPSSYTPTLSLLPTRRRWLGGVDFTPPFQAATIWDEAVRQGYSATSLWWPATFPARAGSGVQSLPGLGTPDIKGRLGVGVLFASEIDSKPGQKTPVIELRQVGHGRFQSSLPGPSRRTRHGEVESEVALELEMTGDKTARLRIGEIATELEEGRWTAILEIPFKVARFLTIPVLTRVILTQVKPFLKLYFLPLQIHPLRSPWPYGAPRGFVREMWKSCGPFLTLGWPQDTTGLEDNCITDENFLDLCEGIFSYRRKILLHQLAHFKEGVIGAVFDCLDRIQHMFWRDRPDILEHWYIKLDGLVGEVEAALQRREGPKARMIVLSDHGFVDFTFKVHLNSWLIEKNYLTPDRPQSNRSLKQIDWGRSKAYAVGLNSLYLNMRGRERNGIVSGSEKEVLLAEIVRELKEWKGPDGRPVVSQVWTQSQVFEGPYAAYGPDLVLGYSPGYRASAETGLGQWQSESIEPNRGHWGADHCIAPDCVPGVVFCSSGLAGISKPSYRDIPLLAIGQLPKQSHSQKVQPRSQDTGENEEALNERLRSLGYL
ncbi:MAG TPA: alkaline phosphatase family protein [Acidobacteriota bacterium]|nr:alkaline phosphatase family protein [Acidobacteriota bacterium]